MKHLVWAIFLLSTVVYSQEQSTDSIISQLFLNVEKSEGTLKLKWLDSVSNMVSQEPKYKPDSLLRETISLALDLKKFNIAMHQSANLMDYFNNIMGNPNEARKIFENIEINEDEITPHALARYYLSGGDIFFFLRDYKLSIDKYDKAEGYAKIANKVKLLGLIQHYRGNSKANMGLFVEASKDFNQAVNSFRALKDKVLIFGVKNSLAVLYSKNAFYKEAEKERNEAIAVAKSSGLEERLIPCYYNAATDLNKQDRQQERIENLKLASELCERSRYANLYEPFILSALAVAYAQNDSTSQAENILTKIEKKKKSNPKFLTDQLNFYVQMNMARVHNKLPSAINYGERYLELVKRNSDFDAIQNAELFLSRVYRKNKNTDKALFHHQNYTRIKDSIFDIQKVNGLSFYQTLYETEKRDAQIASQDLEIQLLNTKDKVKSQWITFGSIGLLLVFGGLILLRGRNFARKKHKLQEDFSKGLIQAQENERSRVALELHDSVGQQLMMLTRKSKKANDPQIEQLASNTLENLRSVAQGLYPASLNRLGFTEALRELVDDIDEETDVFFTAEIDEVDDCISSETALHMYRILQEVLGNMVKHSQARTAFVTVKKEPNSVYFSVKDNGVGFDFSEKLKNSKSLGMKSLIERCNIIKAKLKVISSKDTGTKISVLLTT